MYDIGKILTGLIIFLCLITFPVYYGIASGKAAYRPEPKIVTQEKQCIEPAQYMRTKHMDLLNDWRESVVRQGNRIYVASDGKQHSISLVSTCLSCHQNKAEFCDQCHNYVGIKPNCWDCHTPPKKD